MAILTIIVYSSYLLLLTWYFLLFNHCSSPEVVYHIRLNKTNWIWILSLPLLLMVGAAQRKIENCVLYHILLLKNSPPMRDREDRMFNVQPRHPSFHVPCQTFDFLRIFFFMSSKSNQEQELRALARTQFKSDKTHSSSARTR